METLSLQKVQKTLKREGLCGWLLFDFRKSNPIALKVLGVDEGVFLTRRFFYFIPKEGRAVKIVHAVESFVLDHLEGDLLVYRSRDELLSHLASVLKDLDTICMEISENGENPYLSYVDAGTYMLIRSMGPKIVSSERAAQVLISTLTEEQIKSHLFAAKVADQVMEEAFQFAKSSLPISEYAVQQFILGRFLELGCVTDAQPIVAVNANSADPHYTPSENKCALIQEGDFLLIDLWCKKNSKGAIFADICRVSTFGEPTDEQRHVFSIVLKAQQKALAFITSKLDEGKEVMGWEVDQVARDWIEENGYGEFFIHRLGHNIHEQDHGPGAHLDSLEAIDRRALLKNSCFSIEPGIYLPGKFGVRLEVDVLIDEKMKASITCGALEKLVAL